MIRDDESYKSNEKRDGDRLKQKRDNAIKNLMKTLQLNEDAILSCAKISVNQQNILNILNELKECCSRIIKDNVSEKDFTDYYEMAQKILADELSNKRITMQLYNQFLQSLVQYSACHHSFVEYKKQRRARKLNFTEGRSLTGDQRLQVDAKIKELIENNKELEDQDKFYVELKKDGSIEVSADKYKITDTDSIIFSVKKDKAGALHATDGEIGSGAFGRVKGVTSLLSGKVLADKILADKGSVEVLLKDASAENKEVFGFSEVEFNSTSSAGKYKHHLVVDKISGSELFVHLDRIKHEEHKIDARSGFSMMISSCCEVLKLHDMDFLHLDVKSNNMMFNSETNKMTILDFDMSRKMTNGVYVGNFRGTLGVIAPEISKDNSGNNEYTVKVDSFALAFLIEEILEKTKMSDAVRAKVGGIISDMKLADPGLRKSVQESLDAIYKVYYDNRSVMQATDAVSSIDIDLQYQARKLIETLQLEKKKIFLLKKTKKNLQYTILSLQAVAAGDTSNLNTCNFVRDNSHKITTSKSEIIKAAIAYAINSAATVAKIDVEDKPAKETFFSRVIRPVLCGSKKRLEKDERGLKEEHKRGGPTAV